MLNNNGETYHDRILGIRAPAPSYRRFGGRRDDVAEILAVLGYDRRDGR
jgi:hypothetical protein